MNKWTLDFAERLIYPDNQQGINLDIILSFGTKNNVAVTVKLDTGSTLCVFQRQYAETLGLEVEKGDPEIIRTATGKFLAYGHELTLMAANLEWDTTVYFAADENFPVNVVGSVGFLDRLRIGLNDYEQQLFLNSAFE